MKYANITNNMYVNKYDGESRITCLAINPSGKVDIFSVPISTPSGAVTMSKDPILGKTRAINDIMQKQGNLGGSTTGEVQLATKTTSMSIKSDYAYLATKGVGIEMSRNTLEGILNGQGFHDSIKDVYRKVVGTNGTIKKSTTTDQGYIFKKLFEIDGRLIIGDASTEAGHAITVKNIRSSVYDKTCVYMIFENISKFDDENIEGVRCVYCMHSEVSVSDADDANEVSFTQTQLCDIRNVKSFLINGFADDEVGTDTSVTTTTNLGIVTLIDDANSKLTFAGNLQPILNVGETVTIADAGDIVPKTLTVSEIAYLEGAKTTVITFTEAITAGTVIPANTATASNTKVVSVGVPARPGMISKTGITMFKTVVDNKADISFDATTFKPKVAITAPANVVRQNSITQEYETVAYTPVAHDLAIVYLPKTVLQAFVDQAITPTVIVENSGYAIAVYSGTAWELADAGKIKESTILLDTAVTAESAVPATPAAKNTAIAKRIYGTFTWNFETSSFEGI